MKEPSPPLEELYQEIILEHSKHPRNEGVLDPAMFDAEGFNPLCGDRIRIFVDAEKVQFTAEGCAISKASASILTQLVAGLELEQLQSQTEAVLEFLKSESTESILLESPDFRAIAAVKQFPARLKCAQLPWNTLFAALRKNRD